MKAGPHIAYVKLTIPPGFWLKQVAARVGKLPGLTVDPFVEATQNNAVRSAFEPAGTNNLEGLLWPDTYDISADEDEIQVLSTLVTTFDKQAVTLGLANANVQGHTAYDIIKVASLVEAEAKVDADRPLIASVIYNRLARGMPLADRRHADLRARRSPQPGVVRQGQADRVAVQHLHAHRACRRRRSRR